MSSILIKKAVHYTPTNLFLCIISVCCLCTYMQSLSAVYITLKVSKALLSHYGPGQALWTPDGWGSQNFQKIGTWRWQGLQLYPPAAFNPQKYPQYSFLLRLSQPQDHIVARRVKLMKDPNDSIGNQTCDLLACRASIYYVFNQCVTVSSYDDAYDLKMLHVTVVVPFLVALSCC